MTNTKPHPAHTLLNPPALHDPVRFGYSHTAAVPAGTGLVFVSGQYGSAPDGSVVSPDFAAQVNQTFANLATALTAHGLDLSHVVSFRAYVVDHDVTKLGPLAEAIAQHWGTTPPTQTLLGITSLAMPDMLFEVEAIAAHP
ncbi:RidA family protein [Nocardia lasii]|uniref:RidA family protein n=1 Tax=Nocardia lasii TaxID=1616107 RepID=A0ABW1JRR6_9NOCA